MTGSKKMIIDEVKKIFPLKDQLKLTDKYSSFDMEYNSQNLPQISENDLINLKEHIPASESFTFKVVVQDEDPVTISSSLFDTDSFLSGIDEAKRYLENEQTVKIILSIKKNTNDSIIHIYNYESFLNSCSDLSAIKWLKIVGKDLKNNNYLKFKILEKKFDSFWSNNIIISNKDNELTDFSPQQNTDINVNEDCHFGNYEQYPYTPNYFNLTKRPQKENHLTKILDRLAFVFSISSIFDITSIDIKNDLLNYKLNGYKTIQGKFNIEEQNIDSKDVYIRLFNWIYSESSSCTDKIGLSRNIISIYANNDFPSIDENVYYSIQSGFKTYLQENLNKYIDIRNKISEQLQEINNRATKVVENYLSYYQKSNLTYITYFISVFILRVITAKKFKDVFSKETTIIAYALIIISILYMVASLMDLNGEIKRLKQRYKNLKNRFKDLLIEEDINKILRDDKEFNDEIKYIKNKRCKYTILWIITASIFICVITFLSPYACKILGDFIECASSLMSKYTVEFNCQIYNLDFSIHHHLPSLKICTLIPHCPLIYSLFLFKYSIAFEFPRLAAFFISFNAFSFFNNLL
ncbi:MAG: hypothetical protein RBR08_16120 [Desulforegulaceae bacterium]|nr:hypothetical protein [Desulforegulaceae bacterium]